MPKEDRGQIIIPAGVSPWPHELRVAKILAQAGYRVEFIKAGRLPMPDIYLDGVGYEIKSPLTDKANTLEHMIKRALRQSSNLIIDSSRTDSKRIRDDQLRKFLVKKARQHKQIKRMLFITRSGQIVDIRASV